MQNDLINRVFLLLGTNLGDRSGNLLVAKELLQITAGKIINASSIYETAAWGNTDQASFLNQVVELETTLAPENLLKTVLGVEEQMGREREMKWGPRIIDIDILLYDEIIINTEFLTVPHPAMHQRRFTLVPLAEIAADIMHPVLRKTVGDLLASCPDNLTVSKTDL